MSNFGKRITKNNHVVQIWGRNKGNDDTHNVPSVDKINSYICVFWNLLLVMDE